MPVLLTPCVPLCVVAVQVEDRAQLTMSYVEFLAQLHKNILMVRAHLLQ